MSENESAGGHTLARGFETRGIGRYLHGNFSPLIT